MRKLDGLPDTYGGLDLPALRSAAAACFEPLEAGLPESAWPDPPRLEPR